MTTEDKIKMLTGATAALISCEDSYFYHFATIVEAVAKEFVANKNFHMGISASGDLWIADDTYRWVFVDKALTAIVKD